MLQAMDFRRPLRAITPTLDGDVLAVLAGADEEFTGRQVHLLVKHGSERGVRNALQRLAQQGVVSSRGAGSAHLYSLNRDHLAAPWILGLASMRAQLFQRLGERVEAWEIQPVVAVVFGSVARGEASEDSDLDLLVVRPADCPADLPVWERQLADLEQSATRWTGNDARILEFGAHELEARSRTEPVLREAASEGVPFFGSEWRLSRLWSARDTRSQ
jgi:predicted nucleotidyltransferase